MLIPFHVWFLESVSLETFICYADGASHSTQNPYFATWAIFSLNEELVCMQGICIGCSTNNIDEYIVVVKLLYDAIAHGIRRLIVRL